MSPEPTAAETVVLIHGFWVTPRSWEHWIARGPHLLPAWPGWEQVADYALDWALRHARQASPA